MNFDYQFPYTSTRLPLFARNIVSTSHPLAAQAGLRMMLKGGNAVDAAIAAAAVITLTEPVSNGLGSDAFAILWDGKALHGLNASGPAPATWTPDYFHRKYGAEAKTPPKRGFDSVSVPGAVAGWVALSERFGKLPFADLLEPAIEVAERGYLIPVVVQQKWEAATPELQSQPGFAQSFLPWGRAPQVGELFQFKNAARGLRAIAATKGQALYGGEIAEAIEKFAKENGGSITAKDLADFKPEWVKPMAQDYRGYTLHEIPPNGQGIAALIALGILSNFDMANHKVDSADSQHLQIEAMKLAFADLYRYVADPRYMEMPPEQMLDPAYLASRAKLIDMKKAQDFKAGNPVKGGTIYLTAADENGMMISFIQSNYMGFGSGVVEPTYGISLQNRGHGFSTDLQGQNPANLVLPGKRPFQTIIPAFLTKDGQPVMSYGVMGGNMQPQGHAQVISNLVDFGMNVQEAGDAARYYHSGSSQPTGQVMLDGGIVQLESGVCSAASDELKARGHTVVRGANGGGYQAIMRVDAADFARDGFVYHGASEMRKDGQAAGY